MAGTGIGNAESLGLIDLLALGERAAEKVASTAGMGLSVVSANLPALKLSNQMQALAGAPRSTTGSRDAVAAQYEAIPEAHAHTLGNVGRALNAYLNPPGSAQVGIITRREPAEQLDGGDRTVLDVPAPGTGALGSVIRSSDG